MSERDEQVYPCAHAGCETMRTKAEGGGIFSVCEEHWGARRPPLRAPVDPPEPIGYVVVHHDFLGQGQPTIPYPGTLYLTRENAEKNANLRRQADKNTGFNDDAYTVEPVGTPVDPPERVSEASALREALVNAWNDAATWRNPDDDGASFEHELANRIAPIVDRIVREDAAARRALEDTKEVTDED